MNGKSLIEKKAHVGSVVVGMIVAVLLISLFGWFRQKFENEDEQSILDDYDINEGGLGSKVTWA